MEGHGMRDGCDESLKQWRPPATAESRWKRARQAPGVGLTPPRHGNMTQLDAIAANDVAGRDLVAGRHGGVLLSAHDPRQRSARPGAGLHCTAAFPVVDNCLMHLQQLLQAPGPAVKRVNAAVQAMPMTSRPCGPRDPQACQARGVKHKHDQYLETTR